MNLLKEFKSGDIILATFEDQKELWAIVNTTVIFLTSTSDAYSPRILNMEMANPCWTWTKIMTFEDFSDVLTEIDL